MKIFKAIFFLSFLFCWYRSFSQDNYDFYISNSGNDNNPGNEQLPWQTITGNISLLNNFSLKNGYVGVAFKSNDVFNAGLTTTFPIQLGTYFDTPGNNNFALLNGSDEYNSGWINQPGSLNTYQQSIAYSGFTMQNIGNYSYIYVIEIDKELEKTAPISARKPMAFAPTPEAVDTISGSFYEPISPPGSGLIPIYIHTSNGFSPNSNSKYRYEIAVRPSAIFAYNNDNNKFANLWVRGYGAGYGLIPSGNNTYCNNIIFGPGAAIHHIVLKNGSINHSLFLPASQNTNSYSVVFYSAYGLGYSNLLSNVMFIDIPTPIYSHTSFANNYASLILDSVIAFADSAGSVKGLFASTSHTDSVILNNVYADKYFNGYNNTAGFNSITNSDFKDVGNCIRYYGYTQSFIKNVFIKAHISAITLSNNNFVGLTNSVIHMVNPLSNPSGTFIYSSGDTSNHIRATNNIFIDEIIDSIGNTMATTNTDNGIATSHDVWNNNVYIILKGAKMKWRVTNPATNNGSQYTTDFSEWQRQSGQDKNSLFFDLSNDARGLKAIFIDPDNGDYELANTPEADLVRAFQAGMTEPITCFLQKPTYEQAADMILNNTRININACKNPCLQNYMRIQYKFTPTILNNQQLQLQWSLAEQQNIDHFELERATANLSFAPLASIPVAVDPAYSFIDNTIQSNTLYNYRLAVIATNGDKCYSTLDSIKTIPTKLAIYPNPSAGKINVTINNYVGDVKYTITNSIGQIVTTKEIELQNGTPQLFDFTNKTTGLYYLKAQTPDGLYIQKFIIQ